MDTRANIVSILKEYSISVRSLSEKSGVRRQSIANFLNGGNIHIKNLEKILSALGYELNVLAINNLGKILDQRLGYNKVDLVKFCKKNGISKLSFFGSVLRGDFNKESDVDILIELKKPTTFFELADIQKGLEEMLKTKHKLDVVTQNAISPLIAEEIKKTSEVVYEEAA